MVVEVVWKLLTLLAFCSSLSTGKFLWFEKAPDPEDRCTTVVYGLSKLDWFDIHPPADCLRGGLLWYHTTGRVHGHFFIDTTYQQDFELCLTGGEANALYIWYDYKGRYWTPMGFPSYMAELPRKETCRKSHNGTMDLFFESPWHRHHYVSHVSWEIEPLPLGTNTDDKDDEIDFSGLPEV